MALHAGTKDTITCDDCKNVYQSQTSYRAHKKNNKCYILEEDLEDDMDAEVPASQSASGTGDLQTMMDQDQD